MKKWFTLVELLIVITILGILSAVLYPFTRNYLLRAEDTKRVQDVNAFHIGISNLYNTNGSYYVAWTWYQGKWQWWAQLKFSHEYDRSIVEGLAEQGFLIPWQIKNILFQGTHLRNANKTWPCSSFVHHSESLMFYHNDNEGRYSISTYLHFPEAHMKHNIWNFFNSISTYGFCKRYGRNYAVWN